MRDIRPMPKKPFDDEARGRGSSMPLPPSDELYEVSRAAKERPVEKTPNRPALRGSQVPVTNVHVPRDVKAASTAPEEKPARPLFAKMALPGERPKKRGTLIRLGSRERATVLILLAVAVVVALLGAVIFLPRADVKLVLRTAPLLVDEDLTIRAQAAEGPGTVPGASFFRQVPVEGSIAVTSTEIVGTKATGNMQLVNKTIDEQKIKERSRLVTKDNVLFYMTGSATIPPNGRVTVAVEAAEAGEVGNIEPQRLNFAALDASAQSVVYAEATQAVTSGKGEEVHVVKEEDVEAARAAARDSAKAKVQDEIQKELPAGWVLLEESWTAEYDAFKTDGEVGARQPQLAYSGNATVRVLGYESAKLEERLKSALTSRLDEDYALFPGPISYSKTVKSVDWEKGEGVMAVRVTHTTIPDFSLETLKAKIARRSAEEAKIYLQGLPGVQSVELTLSPFWVSSIPRIEKRINLEVVPERQP